MGYAGGKISACCLASLCISRVTFILGLCELSAKHRVFISSLADPVDGVDVVNVVEYI